MKVSYKLILYLLIGFILIKTDSLSASSIFGWNVYKSKHSFVFYKKGYEKVAILALKSLEKNYDFLEKLCKVEISPVNIVIADHGSFFQGVSLVPKKTIYIFIWPPSEDNNIWLNTNSYIESVLIHEFIHLCDAYKESDTAYTLDREILGTNIIFNPWFRSPFVEATTIYAESRKDKFSGRLNNPITSIGFTGKFAKWKDKPKLSEIIFPPPDRFAYGMLYYLIPANFYKWIRENYSETDWNYFIRDLSSRPMGIGINQSSRRAFGKTLDQLYNDWLKYIEKLSYNNQGKELISEPNLFIKDFIFWKSNIIFVGIKYSANKQLFGIQDIFIAKLDTKKGSYQILLKLTQNVDYIRVAKDEIFFIVKEYEINHNKDVYLAPFFIKDKIVKINLKDRTIEKVYSGNILSFDVDNKTQNIVVAEFNPKNQTSTVFIVNKNKKTKLFEKPGWIKEISLYKEKLAIILCHNEENSLLVFDIKERTFNKIISDPYIKHSITWEDKENIILSANYDGYLNLYKINTKSKKLIKLTEKSDFIKTKIYKNEIFALGFSGYTPSLTLYKVNIKAQKINLPEQHVRKTKFIQDNVIFERSNGDKHYLKSLIKPVIRIPFILPGKNSLFLGLSTFHASIDTKTIMIIFPSSYIDFSDKYIDFYNVLYIFRELYTNITLELLTTYINELDLSLKLSKIVFIHDNGRLHLATSIAAGFKYYDKSREDFLESRVNILYDLISLYIYIHFMNNPGIMLQTDIRVFEKLAMVIKADLREKDYNLGPKFLLARIKKGLTDPYIFINNLYIRPFAGYDHYKKEYYGTTLTAEFANFLIPKTYFYLRTTVKIYKTETKFDIGVDMTF